MIDPDLIERVRSHVTAAALRTPCLPSDWLATVTGGEAWVKCENLQHTGSFKVRGPLAKLPALSTEERRRGVICASAGNHGKGLAWAARRHGVTCTVCVPRTIPENKEQGIRDLGARVIKAPHDGYDDTATFALEEAKASGATWIDPFDDDHVMAGNGGTTGLEIIEDLPGVDTVVVPVGGGGLAIGLAVAIKAKRPGVRVVGVNTDASPGMWMSRRDGRAHLRVESRPTIAEGLEGGVSENTLRLGLKHLDDVILAREEAVGRAVGEVARRLKMVIEGSSAVGIAAAMTNGLGREMGRTCFVLTGSNIDQERFANLVG